MLHNLFNLSRAYTLGIQIPSLCRYDPHHNICGHHSLNILCLLDISLNKYTPSFLSRYLVFWHHRFNAYTHSLSQKFVFWSLSFWSLFSLSLFLPVYLLSSPFPFCTPSTYHWYLRICDFFSFFDIQKSLTVIPFFWTVTSADIVSIFFTFK